MTYEPNYEQRQRTNSAAESIFEQVLWKIEHKEVGSIEDCMEAARESDWNECAAIAA